MTTLPTTVDPSGLSTHGSCPVLATNPTAPPSFPRAHLFGIKIDRIGLTEAVQQIRDWCEQPSPVCRYVVTPNVDHLVILHERADFRAAYRHADLVLADGLPVVLASRLLGQALPERVAGSDVIPRLLEASASGPRRLYLLGAAPGVAERAAERLAGNPGWEVTGTYSPPLGFEHDPAENEAILARIAEASPDLLLVGLGAPKQELWVHRHRDRLAARVAICGGAVIDFLAGERRRAPRWMQRCGLEWLHRLASEPKRLARRYGRDAVVFPQLVWHEWRSSRREAARIRE